MPSDIGRHSGAASDASPVPPAPKRLEPTTRAFVDGLVGTPPAYTLTPEAARVALVELQSEPVMRAPAEIEDAVWPVGPTGTTRVRIVRPRGAIEDLPILLYLHGGGWVLGDTTTHDRLARELADGVHAAVVFVDFTRAPEATYPTQNEQAYAAMLYAVEQARALGLDPSRLAVMGDSAGGNVAAAVTLLAKERRGPRIVFQVLFYPVVDYLSDSASYRTFADGPWLTAATMKWMFDLEGLDGSEDYHAYPLRSTIDRLHGLPDALIVTADDILQTEGEAYAEQLAEAGVRVTAVRYNGTIHDFAMLNPLADTPAARGAIRQAVAALSRALRLSHDR